MTRLVAPLTAEESAAMVAAARTFLRVPYKHRGRSRAGVDCIGLIACALQAVGRDIEDREAYSPAPQGDSLHEAAAYHLGTPVPKDAMQPGDVVLLRWFKHPNHVALVTPYPYGGLALLHSFKASHEVIEHRLDDEWRSRIVGAWRP